MAEDSSSKVPTNKTEECSDQELKESINEVSDANGSLLKDEDEEGDVVVSMVDVLEEEEALQESAAAVLGGSDDQNCTYPQGYIGRQALYSCLTCAKAAAVSVADTTAVPSDQQLVSAGVCLACSHECHEGHDLVELYTKRNFRCDCGNSKFPGNSCKLFQEKEELNSDNKYNQNFRGLYCTCSHPYPDPDNSVEDEMIQCVVCEDWFHLKHVCEFDVDTDEVDEMICNHCINLTPFLSLYARMAKGKFDPRNKVADCKARDESADINVVDDDNMNKISADKKSHDLLSSQSEPGTDLNIHSINQSEHSIQETGSTVSQSQVSASESKPSTDQSEGSNPKNDSSISHSMETKEKEALVSGKPALKEKESRQVAGSSVTCKLDEYDYMRTGCNWIGPVFWPASWRSELCRCAKCKEMYIVQSVGYLLDEGDSIEEYEKKGKERVRQGGSTYEQGMRALSSLDRVQQIELLHGYSDLKSELQNYLKTFSDNQKVVRREDIEEFFSQLQSRNKRRRLDEAPSQNYLM